MIRPRARPIPKIGKSNYHPDMSYIRTPAHRTAQALAIRRWRPWKKSTGPRTDAGKDRSARNAFKGGVRPMLREIAGALREERRRVSDLAR